MLLRTLLHFIVFPSVFPYYFYNPITHDILTQPSLSNVPAGYKPFPAPKNDRSNPRRGREKINGTCTDAGFICTAPFAKSETFQFECDEDYQCPATYKCCQQKCFLHKICSKYTSTEVSRNGNNCQRPGSCERWPYSCTKPYPYSATSVFKCNNDRHCPRGFKCCEQNCFLHKICARAVVSSVRRGDIANTNKKIGKKITITEAPKTEIDLVTEPTEGEDLYTDQTEIEGEEGGGGDREEETNEDDTEVNEDTEPSTVLQESQTDSTSTTLEVTTPSESSYEIVTDLRYFSDKPRKANTSTTKPVITPKKKSDINAIIPEYSAYYYHYGDDNDTNYDDEDYDDDDEDYKT